MTFFSCDFLYLCICVSHLLTWKPQWALHLPQVVSAVENYLECKSQGLMMQARMQVAWLTFRPRTHSSKYHRITCLKHQNSNVDECAQCVELKSPNERLGIHSTEVPVCLTNKLIFATSNIKTYLNLFLGYFVTLMPQQTPMKINNVMGKWDWKHKRAS